MKAYKLFDNTVNQQHTKLNGTECNNNNNNNKSVDKTDSQNMNNGKISSKTNDVIDKNHGFKHHSDTLPSTVTHLPTDDKLNKSNSSSAAAAATAAANKQRYNSIENFLQTNVPNAMVAAETARNGFLAAAAAAQQYTPFNLFTPYLKDMFLAAQLIRGNNQQQ